MKHTFIIIGILGTALNLAANPKITDDKKQIDKYHFYQQRALKIQTSFAHSILVSKEARKTLESQKVYHIDLVYTAYKQSKDFDQEQLNVERYENLLNALPQLRKQKPTIRLIEQTGARNPSEAKSYFHGFVLHYADDLEYGQLKDFMLHHSPKFCTHTIDNQKGGKVIHEGNMHVHIPANSVYDEDGKLVKGNYVFKHREFRDQADIALSGIPMMYNDGQEEMNFSSVGMYEMQAEQNGKELELRKPISTDFTCTDSLEGVGFYALDNNAKWNKLHDAKFGVEDGFFAAEDEEGQVVRRDEGLQWVFVKKAKGVRAGSMMGNRSVKKCDCEDKDLFMLTSHGWNLLSSIEENKKELIEGLIKEKNEVQRSVITQPGKAKEFHALIETPGKRVPILRGEGQRGRGIWVQRVRPAGGEFRPRNIRRVGNKADPNDRTQGTLLAAGMGAGHTYPKLVAGLQSETFGVYNCDQVYRLADARQIAPDYRDEEGKKIKGQHVVCVIDRTYNGSFSFHPNAITCNAKGENYILMFTKNKHVYLLDNEAFSELNVKKNFSPKMMMKDVTSELKSPEDLKKLLGLTL